MHRLLLAIAIGTVLAGPVFEAQAFAGSPAPTPPTQPCPPSHQAMTVGEQVSVNLTTGLQLNTNMHSGQVALATSSAVKTTAVIGASLSISNMGYTTP